MLQPVCQCLSIILLFDQCHLLLVISGDKPLKNQQNYEGPPSAADSEDEDLVDINDLRLRKKQPALQHGKTTDSMKFGQQNSEFEEYMNWVSLKPWISCSLIVTSHRIHVLGLTFQLDERTKLREQISSLGLTESWLRNKPDKIGRASCRERV